MSHTQLLYHIVFRTKYSQRTICEGHEKDLYCYMWGIVKAQKGVLHRIGGMPDHIHLLIQLPPTVAIADFVRDLKTASTTYIKAHKTFFPAFDGWGKSYFATTHSYSSKDKVIEYIKGQKEHHKRVTLNDEVLQLFQYNGMAQDYVNFIKD